MKIFHEIGYRLMDVAINRGWIRDPDVPKHIPTIRFFASYRPATKEEQGYGWGDIIPVAIYVDENGEETHRADFPEPQGTSMFESLRDTISPAIETELCDSNDWINVKYLGDRFPESCAA